MATYKFTVPGCPVPKERPRFFRGHAFTPKRTREYEKKVKNIAISLGVKKLTGDLRANIVFFIPDKRRRDGGNMAKAVEDALNGVAYEDDSQIKLCCWEIVEDKQSPRAEVEISTRLED